MNLTETIIPKSDQLNADDLMSGTLTVTISGVTKGTIEQPVDVVLAEFPGRAYRPSKSMRRVMVMAWGAEASNYVGHRLRLFRNPEIKFGADRVGGIEIEAMSHIDKPLTVALTATRGKRKSFTVQPLLEPKQRAWLDELTDAGDDIAAVKSLGSAARAANAPTTVIERMIARYKELEGAE